jgi:hypothetical protein
MRDDTGIDPNCRESHFAGGLTDIIEPSDRF